MIHLEDRQSLARDIELAHRAGARLRLACQTVGIDVRTLQRWKACDGFGREGDPLARLTANGLLEIVRPFVFL